jgi:hypothetical protein
VKFPPLTCKVKAGLPASMVEGDRGVVLLRLGAGKLICCWQDVSNTVAQQIESQKMARDWPRNLFTPGPADRPSDWSDGVSAIVETTKDGSCGQSGCLESLRLAGYSTA